MNAYSTLLLILLGTFSAMGQLHAAENRPVLTDKIPLSSTSSCMNPADAEKRAASLAAKDAKHYCRKHGYGWRSSVITDSGTLACQKCSTERVSCAYQQVAFECQPHQSLSLADLVNWLP